MPVHALLTDVGGSGTVRPENFGSSGAGTEAAPFINVDGSGGIKSMVDSFTRGGRVPLSSSRYDVTVNIPITEHSVCVEGDVSGFNTDPNGESEGINGAKLHCSSDGFRIGNGAHRIGGIEVKNFYLWGSGNTNNQSGVVVVSSGIDQPRFIDLNISHFERAIYIESGNIDTAYIDRVNILNSGNGFVSAGGPCYFLHIRNGCFSDIEHHGIFLNSNSTGDESVTIEGMTLVRCARTDRDATDAAVRLASGSRHLVTNCVIRETGRVSLNEPASNTSADGVIIEVDGVTISNCQIYSNTVGAAIRAKSSNAHIINNHFRESDVSSVAGYKKNMVDIIVENTATDTIIEQKGKFTIQDTGTRTVINNTSKNAGDPDTTGQWVGVAKSDGLRIFDTVNGVLYEYADHYPNNRVTINIGTTVETVDPNTVTYSVVDNLIETSTGSKLWVAQTNSPNGWGHIGRSAKTSASATTSRIWAKYVNSVGGEGQGSCVFFSPNNALTKWDAPNTASYGVVANPDGKIYSIANGTAAEISGQTVSGTVYLGIIRNGTTGAITICRSSDEATWTNIYTFSGTSTALLYVFGNVATDVSTPSNNGKLSTPKGTGLA